MKIKAMLTRRFVMLTALASLSAFSTNAYADYNLRFSEIGPPRGARAEVMQWWADEVTRRTDGEVKIEFFWNQALTKGKDTLRAVGTGLADMGTIMGIYNPAEVPVWNYGSLPFVADDVWVTLRTWQELQHSMPELKSEMTGHNVHILKNYTTGPSDIISKAPIRTAEDMQGKKIRASGSFLSLLNNIGAVPVNIGFGEVYQAMDRGTVDGAVVYTYAIKAYKFHEVGDYVTEVNMGLVPTMGAGINLDLWNSMPENIRQVLTEVSEEFPDRLAEALIRDMTDARDELEGGVDGRKLQFFTLNPEEREKWKQAANDFIVDWKKRATEKGLDPEKIIEQVNAVEAKYEKELAEKGYPWTRN